MERIFLATPHMSEEGFEQEFIKEAFDTNWIAPLGANVEGFENELAQKVGINHATALVSGTSAIHLALKVANIGKDDVVFCQSLTFSATANPIIYENAKPVFIDSDIETWNMSPSALEKAFEKYPNARAVIVVHLYGLSANLDEIMAICKKNNAILIEDAAESLGTTYKGKHTGTFGDLGIYSFNGNKIITTSGGGMLVSDDKSMVDKAKFFATQAREPVLHYEHKKLGFNYRLSNILAGIGRGQLKVLDERVAKKQYIYNFYKKNLSSIEEIGFMPEFDYVNSNFWLSSIILNGKIKPIDIINKLNEYNIECRPIWKPMHMQPFFKNFDFIGGSVAETLFLQGVCLPSDSKMSERDLSRVCEIVKGLWS